MPAAGTKIAVSRKLREQQSRDGLHTVREASADVVHQRWAARSMRTVDSVTGTDYAVESEGGVPLPP